MSGDCLHCFLVFVAHLHSTCENVTNQYGEYGVYGEWNGEYVDFCLSFSSLSNKNIDPSQLKLNNQIY